MRDPTATGLTSCGAFAGEWVDEGFGGCHRTGGGPRTASSAANAMASMPGRRMSVAATVAVTGPGAVAAATPATGGVGVVVTTTITVGRADRQQLVADTAIVAAEGIGAFKELTHPSIPRRRPRPRGLPSPRLINRSLSTNRPIVCARPRPCEVPQVLEVSPPGVDAAELNLAPETPPRTTTSHREAHPSSLIECLALGPLTRAIRAVPRVRRPRQRPPWPCTQARSAALSDARPRLQSPNEQLRSPWVLQSYPLRPQPNSTHMLVNLRELVGVGIVGRPDAI